MKKYYNLFTYVEGTEYWKRHEISKECVPLPPKKKKKEYTI